MIEFFNELYPRKFWVARGEDKHRICAEFECADSNDIDPAQFEGRKALSLRCCKRDSEELGYMVWLGETENMHSKDITHEAAHCAIWCCADLGIGISDSDNEAFCYLAGYYASRIEKAIEEFKAQK